MNERTRRTAAGLPVEMTTLIGRREETDQVLQLLSLSRLVTLSGIGGVGKTRLALHVARSPRLALPDGVAVAELADVEDPNLIPLTVAQALSVTDPANDVVDALVEYLHDRQMLLMLDNCEHLVQECAVLVHTLLSACPGLRILVTSREPLRVSGEHVFGVPPLSVEAPADADDATLAEAVALFADRAGAVEHGFAITPQNRDIIVAVCHRLDGLPLAIELAAGRMRALSPSELLDRLDDRYQLLSQGDRTASARHQSLWATLDWSYDLCSRTEKVLWERLSVFVGPFRLDAAEIVCADADISHGEVFSGVTALVDKSIIVKQMSAGQPEYRMLESVRDFGRRHLNNHVQVTERYQRYYQELAQDFQTRWFGPSQLELAARMRAEQANLRAVLGSLLTTPETAPSALGMSSALFWYWLGCGRQREGRHWLDRALAVDSPSSSERAAALWANSYLAIAEGKIPEALEMSRTSQDLARELGDEVNLAHATHFRGIAEHNLDNADLGMALIEEGKAMEEANGPSLLGVLALEQLGWAYLRRCDPMRAREVLEQGKATCVAHGERWLHSWIITFLALTHWMQGDGPTAAECLRDALVCKRQFGDALGIAVVIEVLAWVESDPSRSARLIGAAQHIWKPLGQRPGGFELSTWGDRAALDVRAKLGDSAFEANFAEGAQMSTEQAIAYALGEAPPSSRVRIAPTGSPFASLTRREAEVARMLAEGLTNKQIARRLVVAPRTVDSHVEHIFEKLGVNSRTQVAVMFTAAHRSDGQTD